MPVSIASRAAGSREPRRWSPGWRFWLAGALFALLASLFVDLFEEDAYIYLRVVENLLAGDGWVFDSGERVEVASSPLWTLLLALLGGLLPLPLVLSAKLAGVACGLGALWFSWLLARSVLRGPGYAFAAVLVLACSPPLVAWSTRGLETSLHALVYTWLLLALAVPRYFRYWGIPASLLILSRPEGFAFVLALAPLLWLEREQTRARRLGLVAVAATFAALECGRLLYFGDLVANPFYVKFGQPVQTSLARAGFFLVTQGAGLLLLVAVADALVRRRISRAQGVLFAGAILALLWGAFTKDYMPFFRHFVPALAPLTVLGFAALERLEGALPRLGPLRGRLGFVLAAVLLSGQLIWMPSADYFGQPIANPVFARLRVLGGDRNLYASLLRRRWSEPFRAAGLARLDRSPFTDGMGDNYQFHTGELLRAHYPSGILVVYDQMGQTPYRAGRDKHFLDSWGLADRSVARYVLRRRGEGNPLLSAYGWLLDRLGLAPPTTLRTREEALDYLFGAKPDLILLNRRSLSEAQGLPSALRDDPRLSSDYALRYLVAETVGVYESRALAERLADAPLELPPETARHVRSLPRR